MVTRIVGFVNLALWVTFSFLMSCSSGDEPGPVDCTTSNLSVSATGVNPTSCSTANGSISATGSGGTAPYQFSLNGGAFQSSGSFASLAPGNYQVVIKDANDCTKSVDAVLAAPNSTLTVSFTTSNDNQCLTDNGQVTVIVSGGSAPYQYQIGAGTFSSNNVFNNLKFGQYSITVKDATNCQKVMSATVNRGSTGISYANTVKAIIDTNCAISGCHDAGTGPRDWTNFTNVKNNAANIKNRTVNKSMPPAGSPALSQADIDQIACWVDDGALNN
jgi:hypothetical protein